MQNIRKIDIAIDAVLLLLITYYVADELTDGEFSRELGVKIAKARSRAKQYFEERRTIRSDTGKLIWDAIETVEDRGNSTET